MRRHGTGYLRTNRRRLVGVGLVALLALTGCTSKAKGKSADDAAKGSVAAVTLAPADKAADVAVSTEIGLQVSGGVKVTSVDLTKADGSKVTGALRADASSWVPQEPLDYATAYTATVAATGDGKTVSATSTFTTMARPGDDIRLVAEPRFDGGMVYGQAMPLVIEFTNGRVADKDRATIERRLFVTADPPQPGVWHWDNDIQLEYRTQEYWQPGTKVKVRLGFGGLPLSNGKFGQRDWNINFSIDTVKRVIEVDNVSKTLAARQDGQVVNIFPVSLGKPSKPSFSGNMVIMSHNEKFIFDSSTYGVPANSADGYRTEVQYAERLSYDGQFIHAAPWSVADQGHNNVSHGCVNVSTENAKWIYDWVKIGDPVIVKGTEQHLDQGNGWTAWDLSWEDFAKGSALGAAPAASAAPKPS